MSFYIIDPQYLTAEPFTLEELKRKVNEDFVVNQWNQGLIPIILKDNKTPHAVYHLVTLGKLLCEPFFAECKGDHPTIDCISTFINGRAKPYLDEFMEQCSYNKDNFVIMIVGGRMSCSDKQQQDVYQTMINSFRDNNLGSGEWFTLGCITVRSVLGVPSIYVKELVRNQDVISRLKTENSMLFWLTTNLNGGEFIALLELNPKLYHGFTEPEWDDITRIIAKRLVRRLPLDDGERVLKWYSGGIVSHGVNTHIHVDLDSVIKPTIVDLSTDYIYNQYSKLVDHNLLRENPDGHDKHICTTPADKLYSPGAFNHPDVDNLHNLTFQMRCIGNNRAASYCPNGYLVRFSSDLTCGIFGKNNMFRFETFEHYLIEVCKALGLDSELSSWEIRFLAYEPDWIMPAGSTES